MLIQLAGGICLPPVRVGVKGSHPGVLCGLSSDRLLMAWVGRVCCCACQAAHIHPLMMMRQPCQWWWSHAVTHTCCRH